MNAVTKWIMSIFVVIIIGLIVDILFSDSKSGKFIKTSVACVTLLLIVAPLPSILQNGINFDGDYLINYEAAVDEGYINYVNDYKTKNLINGVNAALNEEGITGAVISIDADFSDTEVNISQVIINLDKVVIPEKFQHINKNELIVEKVSGYLSIGADRIIVV